MQSEDIKLKLWFFNQCDNLRCSGKKLKKLNKVASLSLNQKFNGIILTSETDNFLTSSDLEIAKTHGIAAIDCSWMKIDTLDLAPILSHGHPRRLPFLLAANPCHFGKPFQLNCAEAFAAALFLIGRTEQAANIMSCFKWGHSFFKENSVFLDLYSQKPYNQAQLSKLSAHASYCFEYKKEKLNKAKTNAQLNSFTNDQDNNDT